MQCPSCDGKKEVFGFMNRGEDYRTHTQGAIKCFTCQGTGEVDAGYPQRVTDGGVFRKARIERKESLHACATRLNVSTAQLSAYENGNPVADDVLPRILGTH